MQKWTIVFRGKYLYRTHHGTYIFDSRPNIFFDSFEQAQNWLWHNSRKIAGCKPEDATQMFICECPKRYIKDSENSGWW